MQIVVLAGGVGAARFLTGLRAAVPDADITVIGNTGDDITLFGLRVCPDLDTVMYTLGGGIHQQQGWGRADERFTVRDELQEYGAEPRWFTLGDRDMATHIMRTQLLHAGQPLSAVTSMLCERWRPGVRLIPMSDDPVETHVLIADEHASAGARLVHFQEYWVGLQARPQAQEIRLVGIEDAKPAPGVLEAIAAAEVLVFPPSNPVVSVGTILAVPGVRDAVAAAQAPVVGLSPIVGGAPVRGMADKVLAAIGVETTAAAVALHYGPEILDGWLVDQVDAGAVEAVQAAGIACLAVPLMMSSVAATAEMAKAALALANEVGA
jgi:LPPG:FO 2-phospho-L-lactate transferase